jgi:hypothetical protein
VDLCLDRVGETWCLWIPFILSFMLPTGKQWEVEIRATSHTRLKTRDHCNVRALIGRKDEDRPSSLTLEGEGIKAQRIFHG